LKVWRGVIIAEGLKDPTIINCLTVTRAVITEDGRATDYEGNTGRWHVYHVSCTNDDVEKVQRNTLHGWYAHFWDDENIVVVYSDRTYILDRRDEGAWDEARGHGLRQGIPRNELGFPVDE